MDKRSCRIQVRHIAEVVAANLKMKKIKTGLLLKPPKIFPPGAGASGPLIAFGDPENIAFG
jgi:hypothetical protein